MTKQLTSLEDFIFNAPLYSPYEADQAFEMEETLFASLFKIDGHCPRCGKQSTFTSDPPMRGKFSLYSEQIEKGYRRRLMLELSCARISAHTIHIWLECFRHAITKIGQTPSLADIANDESKEYRAVLSKEDSGEFHKAIGLAAHGVGIGSFVYLRRIFERLINSRFHQFKAEEKWSEADFAKARMVEKIDMLKGHLPKFMVENKKIYAVLSVGIHELAEDKCLAYFDVMKNSIIMILDEDKKKKEELELKQKLQNSIAEFKTEKEPGP